MVTITLVQGKGVEDLMKAEAMEWKGEFGHRNCQEGGTGIADKEKWWSLLHSVIS